MVTGLRRGELTGLKWENIDFEDLVIDVNKSVVSQVVGRCKTEASQKPVPLDVYTAEDLLTWFRVTPYREPSARVFASDSSRAGKQRGKQPLWLSTIMRYHIQPVVRKLGIDKCVAWHTFRRGRREGGAGVVAAQFVPHYDGLLRAGADARKTGGTAKGGGDGTVGKASAGS